jgi:hypothetical protein
VARLQGNCTLASAGQRVLHLQVLVRATLLNDASDTTSADRSRRVDAPLVVCCWGLAVPHALI